MSDLGRKAAVEDSPSEARLKECSDSKSTDVRASLALYETSNIASAWTGRIRVVHVYGSDYPWI